MTSPLTAPLSAATAQPASNTAETTNRAVRLPAEHREPFDYLGMIKRIRKDTGKL